MDALVVYYNYDIVAGMKLNLLSSHFLCLGFQPP